MKKIIMLMLSVFVLMSFVNSLNIYTYDKTYTMIELPQGTLKELPTTGPIYFIINTGVPAIGQNLKICISTGCVNGIWNETVYNVANKSVFISNSYYPESITTEKRFDIYLDDTKINTVGFFRTKRALGTTCTVDYCTNGCVENVGIITYSFPFVCSNAGASCDNNIASIVTNDQSCPVGPPPTVPTVKSTEGITVKSAGQRTISQKTKIYEVACEGTGTLVINMDGYTTYDVYHRGDYVETSPEQEYTITECSNWIFDPSGYISECKGTKTIVFTALGLCGLLAIVFIAFSIMNTVKNDNEGISISTITALIGFSIALFVGIVIVSNLSSMICGV